MALTRRSFLHAVGRVGGYGAVFSAMYSLGLLAGAEASKLPSLPPDFGRGKRVVIIGGGIAGLSAAFELINAGFKVTVLEAADRPGGRNWTARRGTRIEFLDGTTQTCDFDAGQWFNLGPARIPSIHRTILGYCQTLGVAMEVEINTSRSALMHADVMNNGRAVAQRRVIHDTHGYIAELLAKAIDQRRLDGFLTNDDLEKLRTFLTGFGQLDAQGRYHGGERGGYEVPRGAGPEKGQFYRAIPLHELLQADMSYGEFYGEHIDWQATMFQPIGGMDHIAHAFAKRIGDAIHHGAAVAAIDNLPNGVRVVYAKGGATHRMEADFALCCVPPSQLRKMGGNLSSRSRDAASRISQFAQYKIGWQAPRFWESEDNIYGGISFLKQDVDLVWYPSYDLFSATGVLISGFGIEGLPGQPLNAFGKLGMAEKLAASARAVERLHPRRSTRLSKPLFVSWRQIPFVEGGVTVPEYDQAPTAYATLNDADGQIFFAGDWLSNLSGWQEGAVLSAHRAIAGIASRVGAI